MKSLPTKRTGEKNTRKSQRGTKFESENEKNPLDVKGLFSNKEEEQGKKRKKKCSFRNSRESYDGSIRGTRTQKRGLFHCIGNNEWGRRN